jgi:hypothetical protein
MAVSQLLPSYPPTPFMHKSLTNFSPLLSHTQQASRHPVRLPHAHFCQSLLCSYLRIKEEYWVEGKGLGEEVARLKKKGCRGLGMLVKVSGRRERGKGDEVGDPGRTGRGTKESGRET